jgi:hypothetical protein
VGSTKREIGRKKGEIGRKKGDEMFLKELMTKESEEVLLESIRDRDGKLEEYLKVRETKIIPQMEQALAQTRAVYCMMLFRYHRSKDGPPLPVSPALKKNAEEFVDQFLLKASRKPSDGDVMRDEYLSIFQKKSLQERNEGLVERVQEYIDSKCRPREQCYAKVSEEMTAEGDPISPRTVKNIFLKMTK